MIGRILSLFRADPRAYEPLVICDRPDPYGIDAALQLRKQARLAGFVRLNKGARG
jgi:hypothetical protein